MNPTDCYATHGVVPSSATKSSGLEIQFISRNDYKEEMEGRRQTAKE